MTVTRGTTNRNARGSAETRRRRREWLVETYRADVDLATVLVQTPYVSLDPIEVPVGGLLYEAWATRKAACRCYRCGKLLTAETVTVDRIVPGCRGGTYRRDNIRPACGPCNSETGGAIRSTRKAVI